MDHKIIQRDIESLIFAEYNPRQLTQDQYKHLKDSITRFGLVDPIIVNKNKERKNIIVGGHQRVKVAKDLKIKKVPVLEIDLTYEKERELNVRLNKNTGEWDYDNLANFFDMDELTDWGFSDDDLKLFDLEEEIKEGLVDDDDVPEVEESICKTGDLWLLGEHRLLCGDATKKEDVELLMDGNKADMVFTDPPYNANYKSRGDDKILQKGIANDNMESKQFEEFIKMFVGNILESLKGGGSLYVCCNWKDSYPRFYFNLENLGVNISANIVWNKGSGGMGWQDYRYQYEFILYGFKKGVSHSWYGGRSQTDIWDFNRDNRGDYKHPTQKPVVLSENAIKNSSKTDDLIIDLFLGSGSTLIACVKTGRKCDGMEIDAHYCDVIIKRWEQFTGKVAKLDGKTEKI